MYLSTVFEVISLKKNGIFQGIILIGFGGYFLNQQLQINILKEFQTWQSLLMIVGIAFLFDAYLGKNYPRILPGTIIFGMGIYFHHAAVFSIIPDGIATIILIISIGTLLQYQKTKSGLAHGLLLFSLSLLFYFYPQFTNWLKGLENITYGIIHHWPIIFILLGCYFLFFKKK